MRGEWRESAKCTEMWILHWSIGMPQTRLGTENILHNDNFDLVIIYTCFKILLFKG